ncbi:hypothetical protein ACELLULO517_09185 [Acidisoma cellulosilytica]|uniref:Uncharacterized protein n=1 Tax=Acidisoma cellulosilyticum TaxID=2802395 RepID=A0A963Z0R8_9PROT|nr:hypothetical protein [Acidisoma cellulosilyticum]MCB8880404.1 hypothetical protein [Acidisoma cellulosilyticum]
MTTADTPPPETQPDSVEALKARAAALEEQIRTLSEQARSNLVLSELKAEAMRAGMVDLDGLKLLDASSLAIGEQGEVAGAAALMDRFRRQKPWLFGQVSTTTTAVPPAPQPPRMKQATDMTRDEYRAARAAILRRI